MSKNTGGRIELDFGKEVRYLNMEGYVSDLVYTIAGKFTDFKARVPLNNNGSIIEVHHKRVLDKELHGKAIALAGEQEIIAACPKCKQISNVKSGQVFLNCCNVEVFFMSEATVAAKTEEVQVFDLNSLKDKFEVWTKTGKFNDLIDLTTVQLVLLEGEQPRKMSFNLYNNKLNTGSKESDPRFAEFEAGVPAEGKKPFWYNLDKAKYAAKLEKQGYVRLQ